MKNLHQKSSLTSFLILCICVQDLIHPRQYHRFRRYPVGPGFHARPQGRERDNIAKFPMSKFKTANSIPVPC